jgi:NADH-quinone oxidoreductase subunit A
MTSWPLLVFAGLVLLVIAALLGLSFLLGQRHSAPRKTDLYESGMAPRQMPQGGISIEFYRVAVFFVIFDVEAALLFAWAVTVRESGWRGFVEMAVFVALLLAALAYLWRSGSLDWRNRTRREQRP